MMKGAPQEVEMEECLRSYCLIPGNLPGRASALLPGQSHVAVRAGAHAQIHGAGSVGSLTVPETSVHRKEPSDLSPELLPKDLLLPFAPLLQQRLYMRRRVQSSVSDSALSVCSGLPPSCARPLCSHKR